MNESIDQQIQLEVLTISPQAKNLLKTWLKSDDSKEELVKHRKTSSSKSPPPKPKQRTINAKSTTATTIASLLSPSLSQQVAPSLISPVPTLPKYHWASSRVKGAQAEPLSMPTTTRTQKPTLIVKTDVSIEAKKEEELSHVQRLRDLINMRDSLIKEQNQLSSNSSWTNGTGKNKNVYIPKNTVSSISVSDREKERILKEEVESLRKQIDLEKSQLEKLKERRKEELQAMKENNSMRKEIEKIKKQQDDLIKAQYMKREKIIGEILQELLVTKRLKAIRDVFSKWYRKTKPRIERHKRVQSVSIWKLKRKAFAQLRKHVESRRSLREQQLIEKNMREQQKREEAASKFNRLRTLSCYLIRWMTLYKIHKEKRIIHAQHERRRQKMESFLANFSKINQPVLNTLQEVTPNVHGPSLESIPKEQNLVNAQSEACEVTTSHQAVLPPDTIQDIKSMESNVNNSSPEVVSIPNPNAKKQEFKHPAFLVTMEQRQAERKESREKLQQKYKQQEEEKEKRKKEEEERAQAEEVEKKRLIMEEKKKEKELVRLKQEEMERKKQAVIEKNRKAYDHYRRSVMKYYGWKPLKKLLEKRTEIMLEATRYYESGILCRCFRALVRHTKEMKLIKEEEQRRYEEVFTHKVNLRLIRQAFRQIVSRFDQIVNWIQQADKLHSFNESKHIFYQWRTAYERSREQRLLEEYEKDKLANQFAKLFNMRHYLRQWQQFVIDQKEEREKNAIGQDLKKKVKFWLDEFRNQNDIEW